MAHGGRRNGSGRPKGSKTKKVSPVKLEAVRRGITPAEVMQRTMEKHYEDGNLDAAAEVASKLAPYVHPRKAQIQVEANVNGEVRMVEELVIVHTSDDPAPALCPPRAG